jgi:hypothetical protein
MSISDERDLAGRLDQAFSTVSPRPAPVEGAIRRGRAIRARRRAGAVAGLAVIAGAGVAVPLLLPRLAAAPAGPPPYTVTVRPPGQHPAPGLIAAGTINGRPWQITADRSGREGQPHGTWCVQALGEYGCGPLGSATAAAPVNFGGMGAGGRQAQYGPVAADVTVVTVQLSNGEVLTLRPVDVGSGVRMVGFAAPTGLTVRSATAYSARGVLASAVAFTRPGQLATFGLWLRPGQPGPARASHLVGSGTAASGAWSVTGYAGPWGYCLVVYGAGGQSSYCLGTAAPAGTSLAILGGGTPSVWAGYAAARVDHVVITRQDGTTTRIPVARVGTEKFFAFATGHGRSQAVRWQAIDAAGAVVASGRVTPER